MVMSINEKVEFLKDETFNHMLRTSRMAKRFAVYLGFDIEQQYLLEMGAYLHDIGKFKIPREILYKPGKLTEKEFEVIKAHTTAEISGYDKSIIDIIRQHHERVDGKGYPFGLKNSEINHLAKIMAIIDVYDAITNKRAYKDGQTKEYALKVIESGKGTRFDTKLVENFIMFINNGTIYIIPLFF